MAEEQNLEPQEAENQAATEVKESAAAAPAEAIQEAHDDFDWNVDKRHVTQYSEQEIKDLQSFYDGSLNDINDNEIIKGTVVALTDSDVVLNIDFKSDGLVSRSEFRDLPDLKAGDEVEVYVVSKENKKGQLVLSRKSAKLLRAWEDIVKAHDEDTVVEGKVVSKTKGGLIANVFGMETFLPGSQIDVKPITDYDAYVGKTMDFKVVKVNPIIKNAVVSHKALIESDLESQRADIISKLEKGQVLEGVIKNITDFGAFIDLGGVDGLLYITDISWGRINHPNEVLELNQTIKVAVLDFDDNKKRISLGLKQLQEHPWSVLSEDIKEGSKVKGKIVNIEDYGAFLEVTPGVEGLIHVSEVSWSNQPINSRDYFTMNEEHEAIVVTIDREERKMSLSLKQLSEDPWSQIEGQFPIESSHKGEVKNLTPYGVFVELDEGIGGMVHISDLSWTKRYNHPAEFVKVGEDLEVVVLEIDKENRKLTLGHKQIEEDPWDSFEQVFPVGSIHEATLISQEDKGGIVQLPYGLEAFVPTKYLKKEDGSMAKVEETISVKILEFERKDKRIIVSHTGVWKDEKDMEVRNERKATRKKMKDINETSEKSTLGDLDVLNQLKEKMQKAEKK
ncbi:MAG: 30S ribosomal protein S1 [Saprospiraceae bacterium]|nr:30S ribosomal protein S1 [Saprospiraceae bacterium]